MSIKYIEFLPSQGVPEIVSVALAKLRIIFHV